MQRRESTGENDLDGGVETIDLVSNDNDVGPDRTNSVIQPFSGDDIKKCMQGSSSLKPKYSATNNSNDEWLIAFQAKNEIAFSTQPRIRVRNFQIVDRTMVAKIKFERLCGECTKAVSDLKTILSWETMEFCNERCLGKYQWRNLSNCKSCGNAVGFEQLGRYGVRFGYDIQQFCSCECLEGYKGAFKECVNCYKDLTGTDNKLTASIGEQSEFKNFCNEKCLLKHAVSYGKRSDVCLICGKKTDAAIEFERDGITKLFCGHSCFANFKFTNDIVTDKCGVCEKYVDTNTLKKYSMYFGDAHHAFCSEKCKNIYLIAGSELVPCNQCGAGKYPFDMIQRKMDDGRQLTVCSLYCLNFYYGAQLVGRYSRMQCSYCWRSLPPIYHDLVDGAVATLCSLSCLTAFQKQCGIECRPPHVPSRSTSMQSFREHKNMPHKGGEISIGYQTADITGWNTSTVATIPSPVNSRPTPTVRNNSVFQNMVVKKQPQKVVECTNALPSQRNVGTMCKVMKQDKSVPTVTKGVQTDKEEPVILPIPLPVCIPLPIPIVCPFPVPFPFPVPIPVPIFIPTTCKTAPEIMRKIQDIKEKLPADPLEAELIMRTNMVAENLPAAAGADQTPNLDDVPQEHKEILKIPPAPMQNWKDSITSIRTIVVRLDEEDSSRITNAHQQTSTSTKRLGDSLTCTNKKQKLERAKQAEAFLSSFQPPQCEPAEPVETETCLKYMLAIQAWNGWISTKKSAITKNSSAPMHSFNTEILHYTVEELSYSLCLFVKEVRKPHEQQYSPDTIYYFCLCIQKYLLKNGRADNIFFDSPYEKFIECLDELTQQFSMLYSNSDYIVTRVREEHLWETHQLGPYSPYALLNTVMYFNTKFFNLGTTDAHGQLSFVKVRKLWQTFKESEATKLAAQKGLGVTSKFLQEQEFIRNLSKLYEFYRTKCPEDLEKQDGAFYLRPQRHCTLDSPIWFSSIVLPQSDLQKMFNRIKFVKEINIALSK